MSKLKKTMALAAIMALTASGPAWAVGGPNEAGNSGKFHPQSAPCQSQNDQPHCPGPH